MGRKNKRARNIKRRFFIVRNMAKRVFEHKPHKEHKECEKTSVCAYCGSQLKEGEYHMVQDEFGQYVKKCNDELRCYERRSRTADNSFRKAARRDVL